MELKAIVCFFVVFVLKKGICEDGILKEGDDGVCVETINDIQTIQKSYACRLKKKCYKTEKVVVSRPDYVCCGGWIFIDGRCIPEPPSCDPPCVNAECTSENNCTCERTFVHYNSTHCGPSCSLGYYNDPVDLSCVSKCTQTCINGKCTDFEKCTCNPGYKLSTSNHFECVPDCNTCENGDCLAPNKCYCWKGYKDDNDGKCRPICENCNYGDCVAPSVCECHKGYSKQSGKCVPDCNTCEHGDCLAPNTCSCWKGYKDDNDGKCRPICENCNHGDCVAPSVCECHKGYSKQSEKCVPICNRTCLNGACIAPDVCDCYSNYTLDAADQFTCRPVCEPECVNGSCVSPNKCECNTGFIKIGNDWTCKRPCESCANSSCESPDKCTCCINGECIVSALCPCSEGYTKYNGTCVPITQPNCAECESSCNDTVCSCHNRTVCIKNEKQAIVTEPTLATMQLTWAMWGALVLLLTVIVCVVIHRIWKRTNKIQQKTATDNSNTPGSVVFTVPNTLVYRDYEKEEYGAEADEDLEEEDQTGATLLPHIPTEDQVDRL